MKLFIMPIIGGIVLLLCSTTGCRKKDNAIPVIPQDSVRHGQDTSGSQPLQVRALLSVHRYYGGVQYDWGQSRIDSLIVYHYDGDSIVFSTINFQESAVRMTWILFNGDTTAHYYTRSSVPTLAGADVHNVTFTEFGTDSVHLYGRQDLGGMSLNNSKYFYYTGRK